MQFSRSQLSNFLFMHLPVKPLNQVILKGIDTLVKFNEVKIFPFLNSYLPDFSDPPNPENLRPHPSNSNENVTPL